MIRNSSDTVIPWLCALSTVRVKNSDLTVYQCTSYIHAIGNEDTRRNVEGSRHYHRYMSRFRFAPEGWLGLVQNLLLGLSDRIVAGWFLPYSILHKHWNNDTSIPWCIHNSKHHNKIYQATPCQWYKTFPWRPSVEHHRKPKHRLNIVTRTVLLSFFTIFRFTSAIRHLFTRAWLRSGGRIKSGTKTIEVNDDKVAHDTNETNV